MSSQHTKAVVAAFVSALIASPAFAQVGRNDGISSDRPMVNEGSRSQTQTTQIPGPATANPQQTMGQGATSSSQPSGREALMQGGPTGSGRGTNPAANPGSFERTQAPADANRGMTQGSGSTSPTAMGASRGAEGRPDPAVGSSGQASTTNAGGTAAGAADGNRMVPGGSASTAAPSTAPGQPGPNMSNASQMGGTTAPGAVGTDRNNLGAGTGQGTSVMAPPGAAGPAQSNAPGTSTGTASNAAQGGVTPRQDPGVRPTTGEAAANAPVAGANSFTEGQARARIEARGFTDVQNLEKDDNGVWRGQAMQGGRRTGVALDFQGNVVTQ